MCLIIIEIQTHHPELEVELLFEDDFDYNRECLEIRIILVPYPPSKPVNLGG